MSQFLSRPMEPADPRLAWEQLGNLITLPREASADMDVSGPKAEVREFWDAASCGEIYAEGVSAEHRFRKQADARYRLEPYIRDFARFEEGSGQDVLEIGVGMGADHLEWAKSGPRRLAGVDLTPRAVAWTAQRLAAHGYASELKEGDAERLFFPDDSFDIVYSWGVLHHSPDTPQAFREAHRVLRPGGTLRAMIYHRPSFVGLMLWARYALGARRPARSLTDIYACHLESPGTKGYTVSEARRLMAPFDACEIRSAVSFADLLLGEAGQQHKGGGLTIAKRFWPRPLVRRLPALGLLLLIEAKK
jgi:SAM-dependent methyltransferase